MYFGAMVTMTCRVSPHSSGAYLCRRRCDGLPDDDDRPVHALLVHPLKISSDGLDTNRSVLGEEDKELVVGVVLFLDEKVERRAVDDRVSRPKRLDKLAQGHVELGLADDVSAVVHQLVHRLVHAPQTHCVAVNS